MIIHINQLMDTRAMDRLGNTLTVQSYKMVFNSIPYILWRQDRFVDHALIVLHGPAGG